jgi:lysyl-tRNA synthetase class 2
MSIKFNGQDIDVSKPFAWVDQAEAIKAKCGVDFKQPMTYEEAVALAKKFNVPLEKELEQRWLHPTGLLR